MRSLQVAKSQKANHDRAIMAALAGGLVELIHQTKNEVLIAKAHILLKQAEKLQREADGLNDEE